MMSRFTPENPSPLIRPPITRSKDRVKSNTPLTPLQHIKRKFEEQLEKKCRVDDKISPVLFNLRNTPVKTLKDKQKVLQKKHDDCRKRCDEIKIGGGVTIWPEMENMRLTHGEIIQVVLSCICLVAVLVILFRVFHGESLTGLMSFIQELKKFSHHHPIHVRSNNSSFKTSLLSWHTDYRKLIKRMEVNFDMTRLSVPYQIFLVLYLVAILILGYFLIDNIFSKNKLSPKRIKNWVRLLVLVTAWTLLTSYWLTWAYRLEQTVQSNIFTLAEILGDVLETDLELEHINTVILYWRTRCLPPTGRGLINILGALPVRDVVFYLQYYSLPILTVILTPIIKLILAFSEIYSWKKFKM